MLKPNPSLPFISVIIPTLNSAGTISQCLESIKKQDYSGEIEIIIADGGSTDNTTQIAKRYTDRIFNNFLKTGEAGKAIGLKYSRGDLVVFIDSDNILPHRDWLSLMVMPFNENSNIVGTEPLYYTYRKEDPYITRYCALMGMNDPLCFFIGNYDRLNLISSKWTELPVQTEDKGSYLELKIDPRYIPTMGANGFMARRELLNFATKSDYFFDIDNVYILAQDKDSRFAKVKTGIIHIFSGNLYTFFKKQKRRIKDYTYYRHKSLRKYPWGKTSKIKLLKFILCTLTVLPLFFQSLKGWLKKRDNAWWFHIPACWITLIVYGWGIVTGLINPKEESRKDWKQR